MAGMGFRRVGEATNPGPSGPLFISSSNPSGLRGKELQSGQLAFIVMPRHSSVAARHLIRHLGATQQRHLRVLAGAPAPLRPNSLWAGSWTGVMQSSDYPCRPLTLGYPPSLYASARILSAQHYLGPHVVTVVTLYGYPSGPTWPDARLRTNELLAFLSKEVVLGGHGIRLIVGDFNHDVADLSELQTWRSRGWAEAQQLAHAWWAQPIVPTCKGRTWRDFIWMSPEAQSILESVRVDDVHQEHSTVQVALGINADSVPRQVWPLPQAVPWSQVLKPQWHAQGNHQLVVAAHSTKWFSRFSHAVERSLNGFLTDVPNGQLPSQCYGRGRRLQPEAQTQVTPPRASRPGEEILRHDQLGAQVLHWYKQLRRLQSLLHNLRAGNAAPSAQTYRIELWRSICHAKGFSGGFRR